MINNDAIQLAMRIKLHRANISVNDNFLVAILAFEFFHYFMTFCRKKLI